ncbi:MAG: hypothetical protein WC683_03805 [bacterium]
MSDFLFSTPDFWSGFARSLDLGGTFDSYNVSKSEKEADTRALENDWMIVGKNMTNAMAGFDNEQKQE